jgi:hypothetical protein
MIELTTYQELTEGHGTALIPEPATSTPISVKPSTEQAADQAAEEEEDEKQARDEVRRGREQFLKVYKEERQEEGQEEEDEAPKEIKFKREHEDGEDMESRGELIKLRQEEGADKRPLI